MTLHLLHLKSYSIFEQLKLEERLLRTDKRNWCLINEGTHTPAIVMGISGKPDELIHTEEACAQNISIIKRFSGGGTVIVDEETLFVTFLFQKEIHPFPAFPEPIMKWSEELYQRALALPDFHLRENDYVIGGKKCGGNAQYIKKDRWLHHTSFLWDYCPERMNVLLHPKRTPAYRQGRSHAEFLCCLKDALPSKEAFTSGLKAELQRRFLVEEVSLGELLGESEPHRQETCFM